MSIVDERPEIITNADMVAYAAIEFSTQSNKIPIAAAEKLLRLLEKQAEAKSVRLVYDYISVNDGTTIQEFLEKNSDEDWLGYGWDYVDWVLDSCDYWKLMAADHRVWRDIMSIRGWTGYYYETKYENVRQKMSPEEFCAFIVISAHMKAKVNEMFVKKMMESGAFEKWPKTDDSVRQADERMRANFARCEKRTDASTNAVDRIAPEEDKSDWMSRIRLWWQRKTKGGD